MVTCYDQVIIDMFVQQNDRPNNYKLINCARSRGVKKKKKKIFYFKEREPFGCYFKDKFHQLLYCAYRASTHALEYNVRHKWLAAKSVGFKVGGQWGLNGHSMLGGSLSLRL